VHATFTTNLFAVVHINQTFLPLLLRARGTIVHTGSIAGIFPYPFGSIYNASKAALHHYAATLRLELAPFGVHVLNVVTGGVRSNIARTQRELPPGSVMRPFEREYRNRLTHSQQVGMDTAAFAREVVQGVVACRGRWWNANEVWAGAKASQVYWGRWVDGLIPGGLWRLILPRMFGIDRSVSYEELPESKKDI
jgi:1-acylglycerone phosphate reductase